MEENQRLKSAIERVETYQKTHDKEELEKCHVELASLRLQLTQAQKKATKLAAEIKALKVNNSQKKTTKGSVDTSTEGGSNNQIGRYSKPSDLAALPTERERASTSQTPARNSELIKPKEVITTLKNTTKQVSREQFDKLKKIHIEEMVKYKQLKSRPYVTKSRTTFSAKTFWQNAAEPSGFSGRQTGSRTSWTARYKASACSCKRTAR